MALVRLGDGRRLTTDGFDQAECRRPCVFHHPSSPWGNSLQSRGSFPPMKAILFSKRWSSS